MAIEQAIRDTEAEIFGFGAGDAEQDDVPASSPSEASEVDDPNTPEQIEGWDGKPLGDDEQWEGSTKNGFDRPLALAEETNQYETAIQRAATLESENAMLRQQFDPVLRVQSAQQREEQRLRILNTALENPDAILDQISGLQSTYAANHVESSLARAQEKYGADFQRIHDSINPRLHPELRSDPLVRAAVQRIWESRDPGEAMMQFGGRGSSAPFMPQRASSGGSRKQEAMDTTWDSRGPDSMGTEEEIWNSLRD